MSRIIEKASERGEFGLLEDGFTYYFPKGPAGALSAANLREIADELDRRNKRWNDEIDAYFAKKDKS